MSWAINNHWLVNFKASQGGRIPLRYRLTTHAGAADPAAAARFAAETAVPPIVLRDIAPTGSRSDSFFNVDPGSPVLVTAKPGEDAGWIAIRLQNLSRTTSRPTLTFTKAPTTVRRSDPIEHAGEAMSLDRGKLHVDLEPLAITTVLVRFAP
jgi:alpha-mannosidase